jgi:hypothetical protein
MNRPDDEKHIRRIFSYARKADPFFALRTTLMVGFPGETESQFSKVLDFLEQAMIDRVGAFIFSPEEGTPAADLPGRVPYEIGEDRYRRLMELQSEISLERQNLFVGKKLSVLIDEIDEEDCTAWGRSFREAPDVDGLIAVSGGSALRKDNYWRCGLSMPLNMTFLRKLPGNKDFFWCMATLCGLGFFTAMPGTVGSVAAFLVFAFYPVPWRVSWRGYSWSMGLPPVFPQRRKKIRQKS